MYIYGCGICNAVTLGKKSFCGQIFLSWISINRKKRFEECEQIFAIVTGSMGKYMNCDISTELWVLPALLNYVGQCYKHCAVFQTCERPDTNWPENWNTPTTRRDCRVNRACPAHLPPISCAEGWLQRWTDIIWIFMKVK